ncbi:MAG: zinc-dependent metalloprotease [Pseudomonadota bacterium]
MNVIKWLGLLASMLLSINAHADQYDELIEGLETRDGFFTIHSSPKRSVVLATLPAPDDNGLSLRMIYAGYLATGLGSNPIGADRGLWSDSQLLAVRRVGDHVIIERENTRYRADADNRYERQAVHESFARSVLWRGKVLATRVDGRILIDLSSFIVRDPLDFPGALSSAGQGDFVLDPARSFVDAEQLAFPDNVELQSVLTFAGRSPGNEVQATAADPSAVTLTVHHSFVRLPDAGYDVRLSDPRAAAIDLTVYDFAAPLDEPLTRRLARRFRLQKKDPSQAVSEVVKPIVFYVDRGTPTEIQRALIEGASWWAEAFEAAGFRNGYRVELLPEGAHPLDIRYNVIQWVHRQTRGWSYGGGVYDPRTGEMLKGMVILGSQRVRQDRMIFEGLAGAEKTGTGESDDPVVLSLRRIRQLSAHEVGHALGFQHNMAASMDNRASVMDYPAPLVRLDEDGHLDFSAVYTNEIGAWDKFTVAWLYSEFAPDADIAMNLQRLIDDAYGSGLHFVADRHSRPISAAHPRGSLWDNGSDPVQGLVDALAVRQHALENFDLSVLAEGRSVSDLRTVFAPIYLYHRYQTLAAAKLLGGMSFDYAMNDGRAHSVAPVQADEQRAALDVLLTTLSPDVLMISKEIRQLMLPPLYANEPIMARERIQSRTGVWFDASEAAAAAARLTYQVMLDPTRLARMQDMNRNNANSPSPTDVLSSVRDVVYSNAADAQVYAAVQAQYLRQLMALNSNPNAAAGVRASAAAELSAIREMLSARRLPNSVTRISAQSQVDLVDAYFDGNGPSDNGSADAQVPPGSPIGSTCWHCDSADLL